MQEQTIQNASQPAKSGPARWRRYRGNLLLVAVSVVVALLAAEGIIRVSPAPWLPELGSMEFHLGHLARPSDNPRLYYELIPDNPETEVNADGYRGPQYSKQKPTGVVRIVGIGDSNMYAWQLSEGEGYLRQLERIWNERRIAATPHAARLQVINLAVPGYNIGEHLEVLRGRARAYEPDLILLGYDHNDAEPIASARQRTFVMPDDYGDNVLGSQLIRWVVRKRRVLQWQRSLGDPDAAGNEKVGIYFARGPLWDRHLADMQRMAQVAASARRSAGGPTGIAVLVFVHDAWIRADPQHRSAHFKGLHEPLLAQFAKLQWNVVDGYGLFQDYMAQERQRDLRHLWISISTRDGHPNAQAHRMIAEALYDAILRDDLLAISAGEH